LSIPCFTSFLSKLIVISPRGYTKHVMRRCEFSAKRAGALWLGCFEETFQLGKRGEIFFVAWGPLCMDQARQIERCNLPFERFDHDGVLLHVLIRPHALRDLDAPAVREVVRNPRGAESVQPIAVSIPASEARRRAVDSGNNPAFKSRPMIASEKSWFQPFKV